jgi:hypothetical protein
LNDLKNKNKKYHENQREKLILMKYVKNKSKFHAKTLLSKTSQSTLYNIFKCTGDQNIPNNTFNSNLLG